MINIDKNKIVKLLIELEGIKLTAYEDPMTKTGLPITIGIGTTLINNKPIPKGLKISKELAIEYCYKDVLEMVKQLDKIIKTILTENQMIAIISFCYNLGIGNFKSSTLLKKINLNPEDPTIEQEFYKWINVNNKPSEAILNRRKKEFAIYSK